MDRCSSFCATARSIRAAFSRRRPYVPPFRQNQFGGALGGPLKKDRLFLFGNYEGFRQAQTLSSVSVVPDAQVRQGSFPNASGVYTPVANLNRSMLPYFSFWPQANGPELLTNGLPSGTAFSYNNPKQTIREDFGTVRSDYTIRDRDSLSATYTIDDGNSLIPLADPLFGSYSALRMQVASVQETHIFSPGMLNTFRAGFSRAGFNLDSALLASFPANLSFVTGARAGRDRGQWRRDHDRAFRHHVGGTEQRRRRVEPPQSLHLYGRSADQQGKSPDQRRSLVSAGAGQ